MAVAGVMFPLAAIKPHPMSLTELIAALARKGAGEAS